MVLDWLGGVCGGRSVIFKNKLKRVILYIAVHYIKVLLYILCVHHKPAAKAFVIASPTEEPTPRASKVDTIKRSDVASLCLNSLQSSGPSM